VGCGGHDKRLEKIGDRDASDVGVAIDIDDPQFAFAE
jgi:hypothetical protein